LRNFERVLATLYRQKISEAHKRMNYLAICNRLQGTRLFSAIKASLPGVVATIALCAPVHAESPVGVARASCSNLGNDFVSVSGAGGCVRIGGHVRADASRARPAPLGYAESQDGVRHASESFHVRAGATNANEALYRR
jgi:hypothetical protein